MMTDTTSGQAATTIDIEPLKALLVDPEPEDFAEPWAMRERPSERNTDWVDVEISDGEGNYIGTVSDVAIDARVSARRIIAAVNACSGIPTRDLQNGFFIGVPANALQFVSRTGGNKRAKRTQP